MKPTASLYARFRRLPLTTKQVNNGFYKGTGSGAMGRHTKHGGYIIEWRKVRTYVVPKQLKDCKVNAHFFSSFVWDKFATGGLQFRLLSPAHAVCFEENRTCEGTV